MMAAESELAETARRSKGEAIFCEKPIDSNDQRLLTQPHNKGTAGASVTLLETASTTYDMSCFPASIQVQLNITVGDY